MITIVLIVLAAAIATLLIVAASKPNIFRVERSAVIQATPDTVHSHIHDFHKWQAWSPWEKLDPELKRTYSGADAGTGTVYEWDGNKKAGAGRMEITESVPGQRVVIQLDFLKPFKASNTTQFAFEPHDGGTRVVWTMSGPQPFMFKLMGILFNMDAAVGKDFEAGLDALKKVSETGSAT